MGTNNRKRTAWLGARSFGSLVAALGMCLATVSTSAAPLFQGFEYGLGGFGLQGHGAVVPSFDFIHDFTTGNTTPSYTYTPVSGSSFLRLDDPYDTTVVDTFAQRNAPGVGTTFLMYTDANSGTTRGSEGAILSTPASIAAGGSLQFSWAFLNYDVGPFNDFAMLRFTDSAGGLPTEIVLADVLVPPFGDPPPPWLTVGDQSPDSHTGWQPFSYTFSSGFLGTVEWIVSNGESFLDPANEPNFDAPDNFNPAALLLDDVRLIEATIPEPGSLALLLAALAAMSLLIPQRRRIANSR